MRTASKISFLGRGRINIKQEGKKESKNDISALRNENNNELDESIRMDAECIKNVLAGNADAFEYIVKKYEKMVYNLAFQLTKNRETALDISQDCFLRAYRMLAGFRTDCVFSTWIYRICRNLTYDYLKKENKKRTVPLDGGETRKETEIPDSTDEPLEIALRNETVETVRAAILKMPDDLREIIVLRDINGHSYNDIADILDIEIGTVKSRLNRAREKLKNILLQKPELL